MSALGQASLQLLYPAYWQRCVIAARPPSPPAAPPPPPLNNDDNRLVRLNIPAFMLDFHKGILHDLHEPASTSAQSSYSITSLPPEVNDHNIGGTWGRGLSLTHNKPPNRIDQISRSSNISQASSGVYQRNSLASIATASHYQTAWRRLCRR
jgi:hypothetical protein